MTQHYAFAAIGTAAALLAVILVLLRAKFEGRRPILTLMRRWVAASTPASGLVVGPLVAIAATCFSLLSGNEQSNSSSALGLTVHANAPPGQSQASGPDERASDVQGLESLRAYADEIGDRRQQASAARPAQETAEVPDVDTMIAKLAARLETQPDDVKGWKMLGWSYLNMDRTEEAAKAYETALKLAPDDAEIKKGLTAAKSAKAVTPQTPPPDASHPATSPPEQSIDVAKVQSAPEAESMIRGMVDQLATRLETSPNDEDGWLRLMRSRMTLGEKSAAKAALAKALETFASDAAVKARLAAAARELGVESN